MREIWMHALQNEIASQVILNGLKDIYSPSQDFEVCFTLDFSKRSQRRGYLILVFLHWPPKSNQLRSMDFGPLLEASSLFSSIALLSMLCYFFAENSRVVVVQDLRTKSKTINQIIKCNRNMSRMIVKESTQDYLMRLAVMLAVLVFVLYNKVIKQHLG